MLRAEEIAVSPELIDSIEMTDYRRAFGSPVGAIFLLTKSGVEIRQYQDRNPRQQSLRGNQRLVASESGKHYAILTFTGVSPSEINLSSAAVYADSGRSLWKVDTPNCHSLLLCDGASVAVGVAGAEGLPESRLLFFGEDGTLRGTTRVEYYHNGQWAVNGSAFFAQVGSGELVKFTPSGVEQARFGRASRYFIAPDGGQVALLRDSLLTFVNGDSAFQLRGDFVQLREVRFSQDGTTALVMTATGIEVVDLAARSIRSEFKLGDTPYRLMHLDADPSLSLILLGANNSADAPERRNSTGKALLVDTNARTLWEQTLVYEDWTIRYPDVRIDTVRRVFSIMTPPEIRVYRF